jgi:hypothetical protein
VGFARRREVLESSLRQQVMVVVVCLRDFPPRRLSTLL